MRKIKWFLLITGWIIWGSGDVLAQQIKGGYITLDSTIASDAAMEATIKMYRDSISRTMNQVIGHTDELLMGEKPGSSLSNFITDVVRDQMRVVARHHAGWPAPQMAIFNIKGIRSAIPQGDICVHHLFEVLPFENEIVLLTMNGAQIKALFNFMSAEGGDGLSGASFKMTPQGADDILIGKKHLKQAKNYVIAAPDYLANGGDRYVILKGALQRINTGLKVRDVVTEFIKEEHRSGRAIHPDSAKRIIQ